MWPRDRKLRKLDECPYYLVSRASLLMTATLKKTFAGAGIRGLRPSYLVVLWCLWQRDGQKMIQLARCAGLEPSTMTGLLDRMERDGFVTREPAPQDRRAMHIQLTDKGLGVHDTAMRMMDETLSMLFMGIPLEEIDIAARVLRRIISNVRGTTGESTGR